MKIPVAPKDERVLAFICSYQIREGMPPTRAEIATGLNLNLTAVQRAVQRLKANQLIDYNPQSKRGIEVSIPPSKGPDVIELLLLGRVAAGQPIEAVEDVEKISVPVELLRGSGDHFVLRVQGDSMIEDHICDGDYVLIQKQDSANNGDTVVALIDNGATLKKFYRRQGQIELRPANENLKPIIIEAHQQLRILGIYSGLVRRAK